MKCASISIVVISLLIVCARTNDTFTYFTIFDQWKNTLLTTIDPLISEGCTFALTSLKEDLNQKHVSWALRMLDASTKLQAGILYGNLKDYGSFDQCIEIQHTIIKDDNRKYVMGKHCFAHFYLKNMLEDDNVIKGNDASMNLIWSICIPHLCSARDLNLLFKNLNLTFEEKHCQTRNFKYDFVMEDMIASVFFGLLLLIFILSTIYDSCLYYKKTETKHVILTAFSALTNGKKLFKINNNSNQLKCLNGMKFISMLWIVAAHEFSLSSRGPVFNLSKLDDWIHKPMSMYLLGGYVAVDTFLLISGVVIAYLFFVASQKGVKFNIFLYYIHRYLRLTPAVIGLIIINLSLIKYFGSGPEWPEAVNSLIIYPCKKGWWEPLIYLQNYINVSDVCIPPSWYIAIDMHLYLLSPLILFPLKKWPKHTIIAITLAAIGSILCGFFLAWDNGWIGLIIGEEDPNQTSLEMQQEYYIKTHTRASPWLIGLILGYVIFKQKNQERPKINKVIVTLLWLVSLIILAACIFGGHDLTSYNKSQDRFANAAFIAFVRPAWAIGLSWIIYACLFGYGGPINAFLSWPLFEIGSRFTYSIYIIHYTFLLVSTMSARLPIYAEDYNLIHKFIGDFIIIFIISIFWTLLFESPIIVIEKVLFGKSDKKAKTEQDVYKYT